MNVKSVSLFTLLFLATSTQIDAAARVKLLSEVVSPKEQKLPHPPTSADQVPLWLQDPVTEDFPPLTEGHSSQKLLQGAWTGKKRLAVFATMTQSHTGEASRPAQEQEPAQRRRKRGCRGGARNRNRRVEPPAPPSSPAHNRRRKTPVTKSKDRKKDPLGSNPFGVLYISGSEDE